MTRKLDRREKDTRALVRKWYRREALKDFGRAIPVQFSPGEKVIWRKLDARGNVAAIVIGNARRALEAAASAELSVENARQAAKVWESKKEERRLAEDAKATARKAEARERRRLREIDAAVREGLRRKLGEYDDSTRPLIVRGMKYEAERMDAAAWARIWPTTIDYILAAWREAHP